MTERDRRALLWGGATVLGAVLLLRVFPWSVQRVMAADAELRDRAAVLARARADIAEAMLLHDSATTVGQALGELAPKLLSGGSAAEASADLSGRLNRAASQSAAKLGRVEQVPDSTATGRLRRVRLRATLEADIRGVSGVLRALEHNEAALSVNEVRVVAVDPASGDHVPEVLHFEVTVAGWFLTNGEGRKGNREG
jgi:hypothetical protein